MFANKEDPSGLHYCRLASSQRRGTGRGAVGGGRLRRACLLGAQEQVGRVRGQAAERVHARRQQRALRANRRAREERVVGDRQRMDEDRGAEREHRQHGVELLVDLAAGCAEDGFEMNQV